MPSGIRGNDEADLFDPAPALDLLFTRDGFEDRLESLEVDELVNAVASSEAFGVHSRFVFGRHVCGGRW